MVIVQPFFGSVKEYIEAFLSQGCPFSVPDHCPHPDCQAADALIRWGAYERGALTGEADHRLRIQRVRCKVCGRTHNLLPDFLHPHRHFVISLLQQVVSLYLLAGLGWRRLMRQVRERIAAGYYEVPHSSRRTVSAPTLGRWERRYNQTGFDGLKPKRRSDRGQPRTISPETLDRAEALKRQQPLRSSRSIVKALNIDSTQPIPEEAIAPRTLRRQLALRDATTAQLLAEQRPTPYRRFERTHFGDLWQGDAMHGPKLPDPANPDKERQVFLFAFLDDHTRLVPHAQFYWNEQLPRLEDCFKRAILRYGRPLAIYVDRGKVYTSKQLDTICATLGIQRILGTPYYPEGRGKIERFFQFVQSDFLPELATSSVDTLPLLNESFLAWLEVVYHTKVHSETGQAPLERYRQDETLATRPVDPTELRQAFFHRDQRKVTKTATFSFKNNRYRVADYLRGRTVELRYAPFDLSRIEVWFQDTFLQIAELDRLVTTIHPDIEPDPTPVVPPDTGLDSLAAARSAGDLALLRTERERLLREQLQGIHFSQLTASEDNDDPSE